MQELMIIKDILRVIYSPVKAFESIVKKPDVKGPFIILALILVCVAIEQYVFASKILLVKGRMPENDEWTEPIASPSWIWSSNGNISFTDASYVIGNYSVKSTVLNNASVWMKITNIGTLNCFGDEGYKSMSFWMNWAHQSRTFPSNSTLRLFSTDESRYFVLDISEFISESSGNWSIPTLGVAIGPDNQDWSPINSPSWENITGLEFMLNWSDKANLTMNIDDLYFVKKPFSFFTTKSLGDHITVYLISTVIGFFLTWIVYVGSFFVVSAGSQQRMGSWRTLFIVTGYTFASAIVGILFRAILLSSLPALNLPISSYPAITSDDAIRASVAEYAWYPHIAYLLTLIPILGIDIWIVALCAVSTRALGGLSWKKAAVFAVFAYFIKFFLFGPRSMI